MVTVTNGPMGSKMICSSEGCKFCYAETMAERLNPRADS
jgi:protein gp37